MAVFAPALANPSAGAEAGRSILGQKTAKLALPASPGAPGGAVYSVPGDGPLTTDPEPVVKKPQEGLLTLCNPFCRTRSDPSQNEFCRLLPENEPYCRVRAAWLEPDYGQGATY